ncbi:MAG: hypothetical protein IKM23_09505 [Bacteroidales bacterium]|nr:hypothetical protein [Bacteroidales bacterium]
MEINETNMINVEAVKSQLLRQKTSKTRFKWPLSQKQAEDLLMTAYKVQVENRNMSFIDDHKTNDNISKVAKHLVNPKKFGLMLCGTCGNGKTTLMYAIQSATAMLSKAGAFNVKILEKEKTMSGEYVDRWNEYENKISINIIHVKEIIAKSKDFHEMENLKNKPYLGIDDMGVEPKEVLDYGNVCNPVLELLEYRYDRQLTTFITTNLTPREIEEHYGVRLADRLREMIEKVVFSDGSYRK